jgi:hypothetical protein
MKAQAWSFDFMASITVFFFMVAVLLFTWQYVTYQNDELALINNMENSAITISETLIRTQGYPQEWNDTNVQIIGLAVEENVLDETKLVSFVLMDYNYSKFLLGITGLEYYFRVKQLNGSIAQSGGMNLESGIDPTGFPRTSVIVPVERSVLFDSRVALVDFMLWF